VGDRPFRRRRSWGRAPVGHESACEERLRHRHTDVRAGAYREIQGAAEARRLRSNPRGLAANAGRNAELDIDADTDRNTGSVRDAVRNADVHTDRRRGGYPDVDTNPRNAKPKCHDATDHNRIANRNNGAHHATFAERHTIVDRNGISERNAFPERNTITDGNPVTNRDSVTNRNSVATRDAIDNRNTVAYDTTFADHNPIADCDTVTNRDAISHRNVTDRNTVTDHTRFANCNAIAGRNAATDVITNPGADAVADSFRVALADACHSNRIGNRVSHAHGNADPNNNAYSFTGAVRLHRRPGLRRWDGAAAERCPCPPGRWCE
jgi:hypothetical protein